MGKLGNFAARVACVAGAVVVVVVVFKAKGEISIARAHTRKEKARSMEAQRRLLRGLSPGLFSWPSH